MAGHVSKKTKVVTAPAKASASASSKGRSIKNIVPAAKVVKEAAVAVATKVDEEDSDSDDSSSSSEEESSEEESIKNIVPAAKVVKEATVAVATEEEEEDSDSDDSASSSEEEEDSEDSSEESDEDEDDDEVVKEKVVVAGELKDVEEPEEMDEVTGQPKFKMGRIERRKRAEKAVAEDQAKALAESLKVRDEMLPPPKGYPTAEKALEDSIVNLGKVGEDEKVSLVCVICPTKRLQEGTMLTVHLNGKDHKRRLGKYSAHISSSKFKAEDRLADARTVVTRLDELLVAKSAPMIDPNDPSIPLLARTMKRTKDERKLPPATDQSPDAIAKRNAAAARRTTKAMLVAVQAKKMVIQRASRKEKFERLKVKKLEKLAGAGVTPEDKAKKDEAKKLKKANKAKRTPEQLAAKVAITKARAERLSSKRAAAKEKKAVLKAARAPAPGSKPKKQLENAGQTRGKKAKAEKVRQKKQK